MVFVSCVLWTNRVSALDCSISQTLSTQADFDTYTCDSGVAGNLLIVINSSMATVNWTFPTVVSANAIRVNYFDITTISSTTISVYFPNLVAISNWLDVNLYYNATLVHFSAPKLSNVVGCPSYFFLSPFFFHPF